MDLSKSYVDPLVLAVLEDEPLHGYAIAQALRRRSDGAFDLPEGTIYPALHRLERDRLVTSRWKRVDGRRRRVYRLTRAGRTALEVRRLEWRTFSDAMEAVLT
jgi:DNA-binding PadR family transcriptional regulator